MGTLIKIAKANEEGDYRIDSDEIKGWKIKSKTQMGSVMFITTEEGTYSISRADHETIFKK